MTLETSMRRMDGRDTIDVLYWFDLIQVTMQTSIKGGKNN